MNRKGLSIVLSAVIVLALVLSVFGCTTPAPTPTPTPTTTPTPKPTPSPTPTPTPTTPLPVINLKAQSWSGATYPPRIMLEDVIKTLEASGRFKVTYYPQEALMPSRNTPDGMVQGVLDIAITGAGYALDRMGIAGDTQWLPRNFNYDKFVANYRNPGGLLDFYQPYFAKAGLVLLSDQHTPPNIMCSKQPVTKLEDVKGKLSRDVGTFTEWLKLLGATPVAVAAAEMYEAFQRSTIDMMISISMSSYISSKLYEVTPNIGLIEWGLGGMQLMMSKKSYDSLDPAAKAILDKAVLAAEPAMYALNQKQYTDGIDQMKAKNVTVWVPTKEEMARWDAAIKPFMDSMATKYGAEWTAFEKIRATLK